MGMTIGGSKAGPASDPNIVPLIDVLLVLIIIFMVIMPQVPGGLRAEVPHPGPPQPKTELPDPHVIVVQVLPEGNLKINEESTDWDSLGTRLSEIFKQRAEKVAFVKGADELAFEQVARAIDIMRSAGIDHVGLLTPPASPGE
jgi:biopolymer transport protein TolR